MTEIDKTYSRCRAASQIPYLGAGIRPGSLVYCLRPLGQQRFALTAAKSRESGLGPFSCAQASDNSLICECGKQPLKLIDRALQAVLADLYCLAFLLRFSTNDVTIGTYLVHNLAGNLRSQESSTLLYRQGPGPATAEDSAALARISKNEGENPHETRERGRQL